MSVLSDESLQEAGRICSEAIRRSREVENTSLQQWAQERLIDFNHWAAGVGLFAQGKNVLDYRLQRNPETIRVLISVLDMLTTVFLRIQRSGDSPTAGEQLSSSSLSTMGAHEDSSDSVVLSFSPWSSEEELNESKSIENATATKISTALDELREDAEHLIDRLIDLGILIRQSGLSSRLLRADSTFNERMYGHLQKHLELLLHASNLRVLDVAGERRLPLTASSGILSISTNELRPDQVHLIQANLRRRHRFAYARRRASILAFNQDHGESTGPVAVNQSEPSTKAIPRPGEPQINTHDHQSVAESKAISRPESATGVNTELDVRAANLPTRSADEDFVSTSSSMMSISANAMDYPQAPKTSAQRAFKCPCCHQVLRKAIGTHRQKWRKHLAQDLYPYTCPIVGCAANTVFFIKRKDWKAHLEEQHSTSSYWICSICGDGIIYKGRYTFGDHVRNQHSRTVGENRVATMINLCERRTIKLPPACPVCNLSRHPLQQEAFIDHLADCIHSFSLTSLPWSDSKQSDLPVPRSRLTSNVESWLAEVEEQNTAEDSIITGGTVYLPTVDIDLTSSDPSDISLPDGEYFDDSGKGSRRSDLSAKANVESASQSNSSDHRRAESKSNRSDPGTYDTTLDSAGSRVESKPALSRTLSREGLLRAEPQDDEKAGRVWAREVDDPWWPCILTMDGGGIRGYSTLLILKQLMHEIWLFEHRLRDETEASTEASEESPIRDEVELLPCHYFDFMYGCSSGGLIATLLGRLRMTVDEALEEWRGIGQILFGQKRSSSLIPLTTKYAHEPLETFMKDLVQRKLDDSGSAYGNSLHPWPLHPPGDDRTDYTTEELDHFRVERPRVCQSCCLTASPDPVIWESYLLRTYNHYYGADTPNWIVRYNEGADPLPIWQVVRATLATPFYFQSIKVELHGETKMFMDGGTRENNPSGAALSEFHALYQGVAQCPAVFLSVGAGRPDTSDDGFVDTRLGLLGRLPFVNKFLEKRAVMHNLLIKFTEGEKQHQHLRAFASGEHTWYKRLNVSHKLGGIGFDEWIRGRRNEAIVPGGATLTIMEKATAEYLDREFDASFDSYAPPSRMLTQTAEKLVRQRRAREQLGGARWDTFVGKHLPAKFLEKSA